MTTDTLSADAVFADTFAGVPDLTYVYISANC